MRNKLTISFLILMAIYCLPSCNKTQTKMANYSGEDLTSKIFIQKDKVSKKTELKITKDTKWELFITDSLGNIDQNKPILTGEKAGVYNIEVPNRHSTFVLATPKGTTLIAERQLPMEGGYNFRDIGGFKTKEGKYTKWGKIFRSDDLTHLTEMDLQYLSSVPLTTIVDFRSQQEIADAADKNPSSVKNNVQLSIAPGNLSNANQLASLPEKEMEQFMMDLNEHLATDSIAIDAYKQLFQMLQSGTDSPLMYHCSAGKDRTGMATALIFHSLGVDEQTIEQDYLASNYYLGDKYAALKKEHPNLVALLEVRSKYLQAGLDKIKQEYGSIDNFLTNTLNVDIQKMRSLYLY